MLSVKVPIPNNIRTWVIRSGTGAFEDIHGTGAAEGFLIVHPDLGFGVHETRTGKMQLD